MTRILLLNVNTDQALTQRMHAVAVGAAARDTEILSTQPLWGTPAVQGYYDGAISVVSALDRLHQLASAPEPGLEGPWDALIWAGFGDQGREALQEYCAMPVISIAEAAAQVAMLVGHSFGIVTTLRRSAPQIEDALRVAGLLERCAGIWPIGVEVGAAAALGDEQLVDHCTQAAQLALAAGAEAICLGSAALAGLAAHLTTRLGVPVIDGVSAAVGLAETCSRLGLTTSRANAYASPSPTVRTGWPVTCATS